MKKVWWKEEVIYQIYPRSFNDSNGDGIGDIQGIIAKLDYIKYLGIDIVWLSPIYQSPNDDNGYDISNYCKIHSEFGTMEDFDELLRGLHARGIKLIMDMVVNHSSDEHDWFTKAKLSKDNPYRDYYIWKKGKNGGPPNNWKSFFGGSAWEYDDHTDEYYLHLFTKKQPDLNWENPKLKQEIFDILSFWLDKGIDGFRMDVIPLISKKLDFDDSPYDSLNETIQHVYSNGPKVHDFIKEMSQKVFSKYDIMTVGEGPGISSKVGLDYVGHDREELSMIFHLDHMFLGHGPKGKFDPVNYSWKDIKRIFREWYEAMGESGWISIFLDNHDFPRLVSRFGNDEKYREESSKLLAVLICTLRGTPCLYQGTELGMTNVAFETIDDYRDVETHNYYKEFLTEGVDEKTFLSRVHEHGRDNARTPMQWNKKKNAGFSDGESWIKLNPNFTEINATESLENRESILNFYVRLLAYRKANKTLVYGEWQVINTDNDALYVYERFDADSRLLIVLNHSNDLHPVPIPLDDFSLDFSNYKDEDPAKLSPWEARIYRKK